jgi:hypothetical protein
MGIFRGAGGSVESTRNAVASQIAVDAATATAKALEATQAATQAQSNAQAVADTYDAFDDRFLGNKTSDPSLDNDGDVLVAGTLYFNTTTNSLKVYDGTAWQNTAVDSSGFLTQEDTDNLYEPVLTSNTRMRFSRSDNAPTTSLQEGDVWYETDTETLYFYREISQNVFNWIPISTGTDSDTLDGGNY